MDLYLYNSPTKDTIWTLLVRACEIPEITLPFPFLVVTHFDSAQVVRVIMDRVVDACRDLVKQSEPLEYIQSNNLLIGKLRTKRQIVTARQSQLNNLVYHELLFGFAFTFQQRSHSALFKLRYGGGANEVKEFKL